MYDFGASLTLKDNFTSSMRKAINQQNNFQQQTEETDNSLNRAYKDRDLVVNTSQAQNSISRLQKDTAGTNKELEDVGRKNVDAKVGLRDRISNGLSNIKNKMTDLIKNPLVITAAVVGAGAFLGKSMQMGGILEQQELSMEHFIKVNAEDPTVDAKEISQNYLADLRHLANSTAFETGEVIAAGTRAINAMAGDTGNANELTKIASDMASSNPTKTIEQATEALIGLQQGQTRRMKEFGFNIGAEDINQAMENNNNDLLKALKEVENMQGHTVYSLFDGLSEDFSKTGLGLLSTMTGKVKSMITDFGQGMLKGFKPLMDLSIDLIDDSADMVVFFGEQFAKHVGKGISYVVNLAQVLRNNGATMESVFNRIQDAISIKINLIRTFWNVTQPIFNAFYLVAKRVLSPLSAILQKATEYKVISSILTGVVASFVAYRAIVIATNTVLKIKTGLIAAYTAMQTAGAVAIALKTKAMMALNVALWANPIGLVVAGIVAFVGVMVLAYRNSETFRNVIHKTWEMLKGFFALVVQGGKIYKDVFLTIFGFVIERFTALPKLFMKAGKALINAITSPFKKAQKVIAGITDRISSAKNTIMFWRDDEEGGVDGSHRTGLTEVPHDNYRAELHKGERVLTKREAKDYGNGANKEQKTGIEREKDEKTSFVFNINNLVEQLTVREDADVDKIAEKLAFNLENLALNWGGA